MNDHENPNHLESYNNPNHLEYYFLQNRIPKNYKNMSWEILPTKSYSPTIILSANIDNSEIKHGCPKTISSREKVCLKIWIKSKFNEKYKHGLEYEKKVYSDIIYPIVINDEKSPFLTYIGDDNNCTTVSTLANFLQINNNSQEMNMLLLSFYALNVIEKHTKETPINFVIPVTYDREFFINFAMNDILKESDLIIDFEEIKNLNLGIIILPNVEFVTFENIVDCQHKAIPDIFKNILHGLYILYENRLVHNDCHDRNIMIDKQFNTFIYDYDRSYSPKLGDNKLLNRNPYSDLCSFSYCNIFFENGRPVDLIKILSYIRREEEIFNTILNVALKLKNRSIKNTTKYNLILQGIYSNTVNDLLQMKSENGKYFSALITGYDEKLETSIFYLGSTWDIIHARAFNTDIPLFQTRQEMTEPEFIIQNIREMFANSVDIVSDIKKYTEFIGENKPKKSISKTFNFKTSRKTTEVITYSKNFFNKEMSIKTTDKNIVKIENILKKSDAKLTCKDYINIIDLMEEITYGPELKLKTKPLSGTLNENAFRNISAIINENALRNITDIINENKNSII